MTSDDLQYLSCDADHKNISGCVLTKALGQLPHSLPNAAATQRGSGDAMRNILTLILAVAAVILAQSRAYALVQIDVDLSSQTMTVHSGLGESYTWPISSGRAGHPTPRGVFRPRALYAMVHSAKYHNAPMPHSIFFYGQYAIHGTTAVGSLGRPASHGCIRVAPGNAARLFAMVQAEGAQIRIVGSPFGDIARSEHRAGAALSFAPIQRSRTLSQWTRDPFAR
jgi:lipoprotein-anchoring transpeptidase ErfK/SrfK